MVLLKKYLSSLLKFLVLSLMDVEKERGGREREGGRERKGGRERRKRREWREG